jgi:hypothetical protein
MSVLSIRHAAAKMPQSEVEFGAGKPDAHCGICVFYLHDITACMKTQGHDIKPSDWCCMFADKLPAITYGGSQDGGTRLGD